MRKIDVAEMKKIQLDILSYVHGWCNMHNVHYWLDCGTLLGCIRHKGYIPWDDDIDIGMLRSDYDKICKEFNDQASQYKLICIENDNSFYQPYAKILDTTTLLIDSGHKTSVNIDLFVYDNAPDNDQQVKKMFDRRDFLRTLSGYQISYQRNMSEPFLFRSQKKVLHMILSLFPKGFFVKRLVSNCKSFNNTNTRRIGNFSSYSRNVCDKTAFDKLILSSFEGMLFYIPKGYDQWLSSFYGNYMKLPPVEKRVSNHTFEAYVDS